MKTTNQKRNLWLLKYLQYLSEKQTTGGWSLIGWLIFLVIAVSLLAALSLPSFLSQANKSKQIEARNNIGALNRAQQAYILGENQTPQMPVQEFATTEEYNIITENTFQSVSLNPLSTFSIDVDTASYSNIRRFINNGQLPPKDAVRIEELINYFTYDYPQPVGDEPFAIATEVSQAPWNPTHKLVHIGLQGKQLSSEEFAPSNLVFLIDVSGSMSAANKLPLLKSSLGLLVDRLTEKDRVSIVVYAGAAGLVLPPTPGDKKGKILAAINRLEAGGSTAGGQGIKLAYEMARQTYLPDGNNRVILASDGDFNVGISSESELVRLIEGYRDRGIFLSVLGFGMGNLKDSKMEQLADKGNGNYSYIDSFAEAKKVLVTEMAGTLFTIAKDVKVQVEFNPAKVQAYRLIGYENRRLQAEDFQDDRKDAGELGAGHSVTALYEIIPVGVENDVNLPPVDELRYQQESANLGSYLSHEIMLVKLRHKAPDSTPSQLTTHSVSESDEVALENSSENFKFSAAVAEFGMILRDSEYKQNATLAQVLTLANRSRGADLEGYRKEFIQLVKQSQRLIAEAAAHQESDPPNQPNQFTDSIAELGVGMLSETAEYRYIIEKANGAVFNYAIAKHEESKSYVGGVFLLDNDRSLSVLCEAQVGGPVKLPVPTLINGVPTCPSGTHTLGN
ncbi:YfbK domain-containing protein [Phormidium sp. CCY1219]|uniref:YfbK domain-containing protein n=1 Tax=Phormidium sp. CCY1219 TaxID=2886104 RepID=UPI002D1F5876|nr:von Willebrand factor type A domain-containing protein [Phormidium sp. CCY1219]MEB3829302.1 von Willebrand factor type A domain-containing protein [Phormidium sp. CCY1219]